MRRGRERRLDAYRDGALSARQRARIERRLERDAESAELLRSRDALGALLRESFGEGPPAPDPERLFAAIRPEMRRIDAEREARRVDSIPVMLLRGWRAALASLVPVGAAAAAMMVLVLAEPATLNPHREVQHVAAMPAGPVAIDDLGWPSSVYDLAQEDVPLMIYERGGATVFFFGAAEPVDAADDVSAQFEPLEGWG